MLSPDDTHVFIVIAERAAGVKPTIVPNYVTESAYTEDIPARSNVGDAQDRRLLGVLNLKTGKSVLVDGSFAPALPDTVGEKPAEAPGTPAPEGRPARRAERDIRWSMPAVSDDGKYVIASARSADNKDRWHVALDPESGKARVVDLLRDEAWVREAGGGGFGGAAVEFLPDNKRIWFLSERDGWMHLYTLDVSVESATPVQLTSGKWEVAVGRSRARRPEVLSDDERSAPGRAASVLAAARRRRAHENHRDGRFEPGRGVPRRLHARARLLVQHQAARGLRDAERGGRAGGPGHDDPDRGLAIVQVDRSQGHHLQGPRRRGCLRPALHAGNGWRAARPDAAWRGLRARRRLSPERAQVLVDLLPRVHVPQPARRARLRRAGRRLSRELGLRTRLADGHLPLHGRQGPRGHRRRGEVPDRRPRKWTRSASASTAEATAASSR